MATTITAAAATVRLVNTLTLGNINYDIDFSATVSGNTEASNKTVSVGTAAEVTLLDASHIDDGTGAFDFDGVILINKDDTNFARIRLADIGLHTADFKLLAGKFMVFWTREINVSATEAAFVAFTNIDKIVAQANVAAVDIQVVTFRV